MKPFLSIGLVSFAVLAGSVRGEPPGERLLKKRDSWFVEAEGQQALDNILSWQTQNGDRDGIVKYDLQEVGSERRGGYAWFGEWGAKVLKTYEKWAQRQVDAEQEVSE